MTFAEWVTIGTAIGIKAFFALFVFMLCCGIILGLFALLASAVGRADDE